MNMIHIALVFFTGLLVGNVTGYSIGKSSTYERVLNGMTNVIDSMKKGDLDEDSSN